MRSSDLRSVCLLLSAMMTLTGFVFSKEKTDLMIGRSAVHYTRDNRVGSNNSRPSRRISRKELDQKLRWLNQEIAARIGAPYRTAGVGESGYDCSGFVWRVFHEAGVEFERSSTRRLWEILPEATTAEQSQFGTLVFFRGLNHIGIVRDANSFYHVSSSQGVVLSEYAGYWEKRLVGFRSALALLDGMQEKEPELLTTKIEKTERSEKAAKAEKKDPEKRNEPSAYPPTGRIPVDEKNSVRSQYPPPRIIYPPTEHGPVDEKRNARRAYPPPRIIYPVPVYEKKSERSAYPPPRIIYPTEPIHSREKVRESRAPSPPHASLKCRRREKI